jgi:hypothetical protein
MAEPIGRAQDDAAFVAKARNATAIWGGQMQEAARGYYTGGLEILRMQLGGAMMHHQPVDGGIHLFSRWKQLIVEVHDVVFHGDELQFAVFGNGDPNRFPGILDDLFVHSKNFPCANACAGAK